MRRWSVLLVALVLLIAPEAAQGRPWDEPRQEMGSEAHSTYSFFEGRVRMVADYTPGAPEVLEVYVQQLVPSHNVAEVQQWNYRADGSQYRVQDSYAYTMDRWTLVDQ